MQGKFGWRGRRRRRGVPVVPTIIGDVLFLPIRQRIKKKYNYNNVSLPIKPNKTTTTRIKINILLQLQHQVKNINNTHQLAGGWIKTINKHNNKKNTNWRVGGRKQSTTQKQQHPQQQQQQQHVVVSPLLCCGVMICSKRPHIIPGRLYRLPD